MVFFEPWLINVPGFALFSLVIGINLFGDGLRDALSIERTASAVRRKEDAKDHEPGTSGSRGARRPDRLAGRDV